MKEDGFPLKCQEKCSVKVDVANMNSLDEQEKINTSSRFFFLIQAQPRRNHLWPTITREEEPYVRLVRVHVLPLPSFVSSTLSMKLFIGELSCPRRARATEGPNVSGPAAKKLIRHQVFGLLFTNLSPAATPLNISQLSM